MLHVQEDKQDCQHQWFPTETSGFCPPHGGNNLNCGKLDGLQKENEQLL
jgi:hypothetical protein